MSFVIIQWNTWTHSTDGEWILCKPKSLRTESRECRENHCQLAQNKSNTSLVPDSNGFVRVHVCDFFHLFLFLLLLLFILCTEVKSRRPSLSHVYIYSVTMLTFMCNFSEFERAHWYSHTLSCVCVCVFICCWWRKIKQKKEVKRKNGKARQRGRKRKKRRRWRLKKNQR